MKGDVRFKVGDEKIIPRSTVKEVYASIEADLIYASENLAAAFKRKSNKESCISKEGVFISRQLCKAATTLEEIWRQIIQQITIRFF
jgi:homogentisate 1,2-dioxygenase